MAFASFIDSPSPCRKCGQGWKKGTLIERCEHGFVHAHCVSAMAAAESEKPATPARRRKPAAPKPAKPKQPVPPVRCGMPPDEKALAYIRMGANVLLVGPKGCGKTTLAEKIAERMGLEFAFMSLSGGVTESAIFGLSTGSGEYRQTAFVRMYEEGGLFLLDEVDAGDSNVLLALNAALANGKLALPKRFHKPIAERHPDFVCIAAANTHGNGADRQYAGRNVLDGAFLARFRSITLDYDRELERKLCPDKDLLDTVWKWREACKVAKLERVISTREVQWAYRLKTDAKAGLEFIVESISDGWRDEERRKVFG